MTLNDDMQAAIETAVKNIANVSAQQRMIERRELETELGDLRITVDRLRRENASLWGLCGGLAATLARSSPSDPILCEYDRERVRRFGHTLPAFYIAPEDVDAADEQSGQLC